LDILRLIRVNWRDAEKGRCNEDENVVRISLKPNEAERRREQLSKNKWLQMKKEIAPKEIISYNKILQFKKNYENFSAK